MKRTGLLATLSLSLMLAACGGGGGDDHQEPPGPGLQALQIVNKGSEVNPGSSRTDFTPNRIQYAASGSEGQRQFDGALAAADFQRLAQLVETADLTRALGVRTGQAAPCRHLGYDISITRNNVKYDFTIPGTETCGGAVSPAFDQLRTVSGELLNKYLPPR